MSAMRQPSKNATIHGLVLDRITEMNVAKTEREVDWARARALGILDAAHELGVRGLGKEKDLIVKASQRAYAAVRELFDRGGSSRSRIEAVALSRAKLERDFWVEQSRQLQNQLQQSQALNANLTEFLARVGDGITPDDIREMLSDITATLREPVVGVEAVRALTSQLSGGQGRYTAVDAPKRAKLIGANQ